MPSMAPVQHKLSMVSPTGLASWGTGVLMAVALAACAQPAALLPRCDSLAPAGPAQRVLVSFREATVADAPAVIEKLQTLAVDAEMAVQRH